MKKLTKFIMIVCMILSCVFCNACSIEIELSEEEYQEAIQLIENTFIKDIQPKLRKCGIKDLTVQVTNLYFELNPGEDSEFRYEVDFVSKSIDSYSNVKKNDKRAKKLFTILQKMESIYKEYILYTTPWNVQQQDINLVYDFSFFDFEVKGKKHVFTYDYWTNTHQDLLIDDVVKYENRISSRPNTNKKPSSNKNDQAYEDGYYDVLENLSYDYERYYTDDNYRMGVDDAMLETGASY